MTLEIFLLLLTAAHSGAFVWLYFECDQMSRKIKELESK